MDNELGQNIPPPEKEAARNAISQPVEEPEHNQIDETSQASPAGPTMYGDISAERLMRSQLSSNAPNFLEKHPYKQDGGQTPGGSSPLTAYNQKIFAPHDAHQELRTEELRKKSAENLEKAANTPEPLAPRVNAADVLHTETPLKHLRTFQGDAAEAIQKKNASVITIKLAEDKRRGKAETAQNKTEKKETSAQPESSRKSDDTPAAYGIKAVALFLSILLILVGISTVFIFNYFTKNRTPEAPVADTLLPYDERRSIDPSAGRDTIINSFATIRSEIPSAPDTVTFIDIATPGRDALPEAIEEMEEEFSIDEFLSLLKAEPPQSLVRAFEGTFMAGAYSNIEKNSKDIFFLIEISSFDNAYSGMLGWEKTLSSELGPIFGGAALPERAFQTADVIDNTDSASGTPVAVPVTLRSASVFEDILIQNIDTRAVRNINGEVAMLYSFIDRKTLLITANEAAFRGIVNKIHASKLVR